MGAIGMFTSALVLLSVFSYCTAKNGKPRVCAEKYSTITTSHSACATPHTSGGIVIDVTEEEKAEIVDFHNNLRKAVSPPATNMLKMTWDCSLAKIAQGHAETCIWGHDGSYQRVDFGRFHVGQNIAGIWVSEGSPKQSWTIQMQGWADEKKYFTYNVKTTEDIEHYTQMVWAKSSKVGCGVAACNWNDGWLSYYYVCNYGPAGNVGGYATPYKTGSKTASDCPLKAVDGLCDCGSNACLNGGTLDPNTCKCTCMSQYGYVASNNCALDCSKLNDDSSCNGFYADCSKYGARCPNLCNWCPVAGV